jgi:hypothetical protein
VGKYGRASAEVSTNLLASPKSAKTNTATKTKAAGLDNRAPEVRNDFERKRQLGIFPQLQWKLPGARWRVTLGRKPMPEPSERTQVHILVEKDGTYAIEVKPSQDDAPLTISGFTTEDEARRWISEEDSFERRLY